MRVTKVIKDYIEKMIQQKYDIASDKIDKEYRQMHNAFCEEIEELRRQTEEKAIAIAAKYGYKYPVYGNRTFGSPSNVFISIDANDGNELERIKREKLKLNERRKEALEQIYFNLEVGSTDKSELQSVLDSVNL